MRMPKHPERMLLSALALVLLTVSAPAAHADGDARKKVETLVAAFEHEPSVREVQRRALRHARSGAGTLADWRRRARLGNALPTLEGEFGYETGEHDEIRFREELELSDDRGRYRRDSRNRLVDENESRRTFAVSAEWDLGGLIFDRDEVAVAREARQRREERADVVSRATELYFERREKQIIALIATPEEWRRWLELQMSIQRTTARLDALTGGWFSNQVRSSGQEPTP
ncbi:MAG: hypothetical protein ABEL76_15240 [Bradymonadaceae bacterium]